MCRTVTNPKFIGDQWKDSTNKVNGSRYDDAMADQLDTDNHQLPNPLADIQIGETGESYPV